MLDICKDPVFVEEDVEDYVKQRLDAKPEMIKSNSYIDDIYKKIAADPNPRETIRSI